MVRDCVANMVIYLQERGFAPRRWATTRGRLVAPGTGVRTARSPSPATSSATWYSNAAARRAASMLESSALGISDETVYAETPDWLISRLGRVPIEPASFEGGA